MNTKSGLGLTLRTLERSIHTVAVDVLVEAMQGPDDSNRDRAAVALLGRGCLRSRVEFVRFVDSLPDRGCSIFRAHRNAAGQALDHVLREGSPAERHQAMGVVRDWEDFGRLGAVLETASTGDEFLRGTAIENVEFLVERLHERHANRDGAGLEKATGHNVVEDLRSALAALLAATRVDELEAVHDVAVRSILVLGTASSTEVRELLWNAGRATRERAVETLRNDVHPGVVDLLLDFLETPYPHPVVYDCLSQRTDRMLVTGFLKRVDDEPSRNFAANLAQIQHLDWLVPDYVDSLPPDLQRPAVRLLDLLPTSSHVRNSLLDWVTRHGSGEARRAASDHLASLPAARVEEVVNEGLEDEDADVQAWATSQLRSRAIPNGLALLVERLDDPVAEVRRVARGELAGFNLDLLLRIHTTLSPERALQAGRLLVKTDVHTRRKLGEEFFHPQRSRRIRALQAVAKLGLASFVEDDLLRLMDEEDPLVRRAAVDCLRDASARVVPALRGALDDPNRRVREAAKVALESVLAAGTDPPRSAQPPVGVGP